MKWKEWKRSFHFLFLTNYDPLKTLMYPYHNKIKQRIKNDELIKYEFVEKYNQIKPALLLYFKTEPFIRPIREHRFEEYNEILKDFPEIVDSSTL